MLASASLILVVSASTSSPTFPNFSLVFSISSFCFSTEATELVMLSFARLVSSFNLLMISVMLLDASFVCSES